MFKRSCELEYHTIQRKHPFRKRIIKISNIKMVNKVIYEFIGNLLLIAYFK